ncbi:MAG: endopeptidase La [Erysipelotrichaceae bacterium]|nr:endopeptidase La [Erysipelotrichaceae bacterium]
MAVLPIYNMIAVPDANIYFKTDDYRNMTGKNPIMSEKVTLIISRHQKKRNELTSDSFYPIGINGVIDEINKEGYISISLRNRVNIDEVYIYPDGRIDLSLSTRHDIQDLDEEDAERRLNALKRSIINYSQNNQYNEAIRIYAARWQHIEQIGVALSPWMIVSNKERYELLAIDSQQERFNRIEELIYESLEMNKISNKARNEQEEEYQKMYRESAIKKQMDILQQELDEMHPENVSDIRRMEIQLEESEMNETARKEAQKIINRIKSEGQNGAETGMLMDYMDFMLSLPWAKEKGQYGDLKKAGEILDEDHFGLDKVKKRILEQIAVMNLKGQQSGSILLFVGAPGTGKTSIGQSIARALDRAYVRVSLGGVRDEADIRGHRRTYIGAMPGRIIDGIHKSGVSNPVMVLDEVDKLSMSYNGDPASALLEVLDPEQNSTFTDHYLNVPFDLSDVFFICTANTLETIPEPLLNRMEVIQFQGYTPLEKLEIAKQHLLPKAIIATGLKDDQINVTDEAIAKVIDDYTREAGVRGLKKRMDMICRSTAVKIVSGDVDHIDVTTENVGEFMDINPLPHKNVRESAHPGIVTGLAWTSVGGEILYIETIKTKGKGKLTITGQLGDVMKESAQIALSLVKSIFPEEAKIFDEHDIHIHVPDGATPKDGPSAGITLTTALSSLITDVAVSPAVAMTGEVSLQGRVNPIGGLPEKLMAAQRSGVKRVFIPVDNVNDLKDVAQEVKDTLTITPVSEVTDVLKALSIL